MTQHPERDLNPTDEWRELILLINNTVEKPSRTRFTEVGQQAVRWHQAARQAARESALDSAVETPIYNDVVAETTARDHLGRRLKPDAGGGYTVEATPDDELLVDLDDQD